MHVFTEEIPILSEKLEWLKPFFYGCKQMEAVYADGIPGILGLVDDTTADIEEQELMSLIFHNIRFRRLRDHNFTSTGPPLKTFHLSSSHHRQDRCGPFLAPLR
jgi:hypothetical protein